MEATTQVMDKKDVQAKAQAKAKAKKSKGIRADIDLLLHKPTAKAKLRRRNQLIHRGLRWCIQIAFFALYPAVFSASFNGVKYIFQQIGTRQPIEATSFTVLLAAVLLFTCIFGRFFCGFACAFGTLGDAVYTLFTPLRRLIFKRDKIMSPAVHHVLQFVKYGVLAGICALCFMGVWSEYSGYSPWVSFAGITALSIEGIGKIAFVALGLVVLGMALVERFFCQFLCPLGAVFSLMPVLPVSLFRRDRERCARGCNRCQESCPVSIHPDRDSWFSGECVECGRCADGCPMANITLLKIDAALPSLAEQTAEVSFEGATSKPARPARKPEPRFAIHGNEIVVTLLKAAALFAVCYALL